MTRKVSAAALVIVTASLFAAGPVLAKSPFLDAFNSRYGTRGSRLDDCSLCHPGGRTGSLNGYGTAFGGKMSLGSTNALVAIETADSDGDGHRNIDEIKALSFPGDPNDKPAAGGTLCTDGDKDGYYAQSTCGTAADCDDADASVHPGAPEVCGDGVDQDCSGGDQACRTGKTKGPSPSEGKGKTCSDRIDNDANGFTDCADPGCASSRACR
jgi:hypothetical protein